MRWSSGSRDSIDDERGGSPVMRAGLPIGIGGAVILLVGSWLTGTNLFSLLGTSDATDSPPAESRPAATSPAEEKLVDFVGAVTDDLQATWRDTLGSRYQPTRVVLFRDAIDSTCGMAQSATGPFYCPSDRRVYLDLAFFGELNRLGAPGDFAQAYVLAHEVGHHIQLLLGTEARIRAQQERAPQTARALSVGLELQADCFAGVWAHAARQPGRFLAGRVELEPGDVEEGLNAAAAIGDDRLQRMQTGHVVPDSFTHGSSAQRSTWFRRGLDGGTIESCDTFAAR
jgi:predicted metalloprotease